MSKEGSAISGSVFLAPASHIRAVDFVTVLVLLDVRTSSVEALTGAARDVWITAASSGDARAATGLGTSDIRQFAHQLAARGLLSPASADTPVRPPAAGHAMPPSWGTQDHPAQLHPIPAPPRRWYLPATVAIFATLIVGGSGCRRRRFARLVTVATGVHGRRPADERTARHAVRAVRRVALLIPARLACLEESTAAVLTLAAAGYRVHWRHGIATDPVRMHAWIEADTKPIDEGPDIIHYTPTW